MEEALMEVPTMRRFAGIDLITDRIPDETTILTFRHLLERYKLGEQIFETVKAHLSSRGMTTGLPESRDFLHFRQKISLCGMGRRLAPPCSPMGRKQGQNSQTETFRQP